jgi:hypothetical protein
VCLYLRNELLDEKCLAFHLALQFICVRNRHAIEQPRLLG